MANDCMNTLWFCSMDKNLLHQLFDKFRSCFDTICEGKVADLLKKHGYSSAEADRRDYITGCDGIISRNEAYYYFQAEIISAWAPHMDVLFKLLREKYADKIRLLYVSEEPGFDVFVTNDYAGIFFKERYYLDCCCFGKFHHEYFDSLSRMITYIREKLGVDVSEIDSLNDMENTISSVCCHEDDDYCTIRSFDVENEERSAA
jgi:hypothetical protein